MDCNFPRPILTFLAVAYKSEEIEDISKFQDFSLVFIPQMVRDLLAIHDDIIDEDLVKFNSDTLPFSFSKLIDEKFTSMTKSGKDLAILFGDYISPYPYQIVSNLKIEDNIKIKIIRAINDVLKKTNLGQIQELLFNDEKLININKQQILEMYKAKAADYCYAFPFEIGLLYAKAPKQLVDECRNILLQIGTYSQIVNDMEGIFSEDYNNERDTLSDLIYLRRSYLLIKLAKLSKQDKRTQTLLRKKELSQAEALFIKQKLREYKICTIIAQEIEKASEKLKKQISQTSLGKVCKEYFYDLIDVRVISNLKKQTCRNSL